MMSLLMAYREELLNRLLEHVFMCGVTLSASCLIAVPAGIWMSGYPRVARLFVSLSSLIQTVPSLALLGLLMVLTGAIGYIPSLLALFLYSLLPILQNTYTGIRQTPQAVRQAALALGMTDTQILWQVSVPLAMPVIAAGVRTSSVLVIGTATLCAFIGAGGLGVPINRGIETVNPGLVMLGVVPVAALALAVDWMLRRLAAWLSVPGIEVR